MLDAKHKKSLGLGLFLASTLFAVNAIVLAYTGFTYEGPLQVDNTGGATTGSTASTGASLSTGTVVILAISAFAIGLTVFGFLHEVHRKFGKTSGESGSLQPGLQSVPSGEQEWEEFPRRVEDEESATSA